MKGINLMVKDVIILNSESEFRNCVNSNLENVSQIFVFEDILDKIIFFYCFTKNDMIYATKEPSKNNFKTYSRFYKRLSKKLHLQIFLSYKQLISIKM